MLCSFVVHTLRASYTSTVFCFVLFPYSQAENNQAQVMKLECELRDREHLLIDMRNKLATLEAQMEYVSYSNGYTLSQLTKQ